MIEILLLSFLALLQNFWRKQRSVLMIFSYNEDILTPIMMIRCIVKQLSYIFLSLDILSTSHGHPDPRMCDSFCQYIMQDFQHLLTSIFLTYFRIDTFRVLILIVFGFSEKPSAENSKSSADSRIHGIQL